MQLCLGWRLQLRSRKTSLARQTCYKQGPSTRRGRPAAGHHDAAATKTAPRANAAAKLHPTRALCALGLRPDDYMQKEAAWLKPSRDQRRRVSANVASHGVRNQSHGRRSSAYIPGNLVRNITIALGPIPFPCIPCLLEATHPHDSTCARPACITHHA